MDEVKGRSRSAARTRGESWARLDVEWFDDHVLRAAAEIEPACLVLWPILVAKAKADSHVEANPTGRIRTTTRTLATCALVDVEQVDRALALLVEGEFLTSTEARFGAVEIELAAFERWQTPRASKAERDEVYRHKLADPRAGKKSSNATVERRGDDGDATAPRHKTGDWRLETSSVPNGTVDETAPRLRRVPTRADDEWEAERDTIRERLDTATAGLGAQVAALVDVLAAENRTGRVALSRSVRALWRPIAEALDTYPPDAVAYGVEQALAANDGRGVPNANYVKKSAARYAARGEATTTKRGNHDDHDTAAGSSRADYVFGT